MRTLTFFLLAILLTTASCRLFGKRVKGNGTIETVNRDTESFSSVSVSGAFDVFLKKEDRVSVAVQGDANLLKYVLTRVDDGRLVISVRGNVNLRPTRGMRVYVSAPLYRTLRASGSCDYYSDNKLVQDDPMEVRLSGSCDLDLELQCPRVKVTVSGASGVKLKGETRDFEVSASGSAGIKCFDLLAENTRVRISGAGSAEVFASQKLDVRVSGAGSVKYRGKPEVNQSISGAGSVRQSP